MTLVHKTYETFDTLLLAFLVSPVYTMLYILLSIIHAIMPTAGTALATANFVNSATAILQGERPHGDIYMPLMFLLLVLGVFTTIGSIVQLVSSRISLDLQNKLKPTIVNIHASLEYKHIESSESWELISRVSRDPTKSIMDGLDGLMQMMRIVVSIIAVLALIVSQVWWAAIIIIAFSTPMFWLSMYMGKKKYQAGRDAEKFNRRTEYLDEVLTGRDCVDERTLFGYGDEVDLRWQEQYEAGRVLQLNVSAKMLFISHGPSMLLTLIALLIALTLISPVITGQMTPGVYMGIVVAVLNLIQQLGWQMFNSLECISRVGEYMKDLTAFCALSETPEASDMPDPEPMEFATLEFRNVRFKYPGGDRYILDGLSITLEGGRHYAFVGKNGAGKTTIAKLLTGLYAEYEGEILINGKELREHPARTLKAMFSVVYQDFAKYYIPLKDNIALGDIVGNTEESVSSAAKLAGLDETINELKDGIDTPLGRIKNCGQDISGGQWQRVAIARSIISRAPVKILDEPTAALDPISESRIYGEFKKLMSGKTTMLISHRLGSTKLADEILVIDDGRIIERGTHNELMDANGQYAEMFESQRGWYQ